MELEVGTVTGAGYAEKDTSCYVQRNSYSMWNWETRAGTAELHLPKLRNGSYFLGFLEPCRVAEKALTAVLGEDRSPCCLRLHRHGPSAGDRRGRRCLMAGHRQSDPSKVPKLGPIASR